MSEIAENAETAEIAEMQLPPHISLKMQSASRGVMVFRLRRLMPMGKLKDAYCSQVGIAKDLVCLTFDGENITDTDTANSLQLDEDDIIDVMIKHQDEAGDAAVLETATES